MNDGTNCPTCGKDIGIMSIFLAGLPSRIRCPHCKARLRYSETKPVLWTLALLALVGFGVAFYLAPYVAHFSDKRFERIAFIATFLIIWTPVELLTAIYLRRHKKLIAI